MKSNHRNHENSTGKLSEQDIQHLNVWLAGYRSNPTTLEFYIKKASTYAIIPQKYRFSTTRVAPDGTCLDCEKKRCPVCNGCPDVDIFKKVEEITHCQRCICSAEQEQEQLNVDIPLDELVRKRQGKGFKKEGNK